MRVLLVEDNDGDAELVTDALTAAISADVQVARVVRLREATARLEQERFDVVLLDLSLPDAAGFDGLTRLRAAVPLAPIVVLTGQQDSARGLAAIQQGAQDYLQKGHAGGPDLLRALRFAHERAQYIERSQILADVSAALGSSVDPEQMVRALAENLERGFADLCEATDLRRPDDSLRASDLGSSAALSPRPARLLSPLAALGEADPACATVEDLRARGFDSAIVVSVRVRGMLEGSLCVARRPGSRPYGTADLPLLEEISRRTVAAVEYAALIEVAQRERERAEVAGRVRDEFLATLSHELRTPLTAILGWTSMLRAGRVTPERQAAVFATIERNALAQVALVEDVLDVSRIITGKLRLSVREVVVPSILASAIESIQPAAASKGIVIELDAASTLAVVQGDPDRWLQVLWNLLSNAVKYTKEGGRVHVRAKDDGAFVTVEVTDTGVGIAPDLLPRVFERFWQADSTMTRAHGGLGLGLAITRHLVELQGGTISVTSNGVGTGSTFAVRFPLGGGFPARLPADVPKALVSQPTVVDDRKLAGVKVLLVEDDRDTRELMVAMLEAIGAEVVAAESAFEGMAALLAHRPDVIVSDIGMPERSGLDFVRDVRALPADAGGETPSLALTAYVGASDRRRSLAAGFDAHLSKPTDATVLADTILRVTRRSAA